MSKCKSKMWSIPLNSNLLLILVLAFSSSFLIGVSAQGCVDNDDCYPRCCDFDTGKCHDSPCLTSHEFEGIGRSCECNAGEVHMCQKINKGACVPGKIRPFCCEGQVRGGPGPDSENNPGPGIGPGIGPDPLDPEPENPSARKRMRKPKRPSSSSRRYPNSRGRNLAPGRSTQNSNSRPEMEPSPSKSGQKSGTGFCDCTKGSFWRTSCLRMSNGCCNPDKRIEEGCCYTREAHLKCTHTDYDIKQFLYDSE